MRMEQLEKDARRPMRRELEYHHKSTDPQDNRSASYVVRDGDSASTSSQVKNFFNGSDRNADLCADGT